MAQDTESEPENIEPLWQLWHVLLNRLLYALRPEANPTAAEMNVARAFLKDNNVTASNRPDIRNGLRELATLTSLPFEPPKDH